MAAHFTNRSGTVVQYVGIACVTLRYRCGADGLLCPEDDVENAAVPEPLAALRWLHTNNIAGI